jgi:hypothetical protein
MTALGRETTDEFPDTRHSALSLESNRRGSLIGPNAAICDFHNDGPTPCEEANRRIFIDSGFNGNYILLFG